MHPIERLRFVARASGASVDDMVTEAAASLAGFAEDPVSLVTACRRLIDRHPANGPIWWLCARTLLATDPAAEPGRCRREYQSDPTIDTLADELPADATVVVVGWAERLAPALARRGDLQVRVLDVDGDGPGFVRGLERLDIDATDISPAGLAPAVASADLVLIDGSAIGPDLAVTACGSWPAAAVARASGVAVWLVGGRGRTLPAPMWSALHGRLVPAATAPWECGHDLVPLDLVDRISGPRGHRSIADAVATVDVPDAAELRR